MNYLNLNSTNYLISGPNGTKICGLSFEVQLCVASALMDYLELKEENATVEMCDCLPLCTSLSYDFDLSFSDLKANKYFQIFENPHIGEAQFSRLIIFFKEMQFITLKRYELYGPIDFLANCGGLLGLFMGFSMLSFIELLYFCSLRLMNNIFKRDGLKGVDDCVAEEVENL